MAKISGVGKERIISGNKYFPIYFRFNKQRYNTSVKADSKLDAYRQLQTWQTEIMTKPKVAVNNETDYDVIREKLRRDVSSDTEKRKTINRYLNVFNRLFIEFRQKYYPTLSGCNGLPMGFFRNYKSYFCEELGRRNGWRAELIFVKAIIGRLTGLGNANEDDLKQIRGLPTPEGTQRLMPKHTEKQIDDLLEYIKKDRPDYYKPIKFMHLVGRRVEETCLIMKEDVTCNGLDPILIQTKPITAKIKNQMPPPIYLNDLEIKSFIRSALSNNKTPWLFPLKKGSRIRGNYLWKYLSKISPKVIGVYITPHFFDKRFQTISHRDGLNKDAMAMAGRKNVSIALKYYVETTPEGQKKVLEKNRERTYNGNG